MTSTTRSILRATLVAVFLTTLVGSVARALPILDQVVDATDRNNAQYIYGERPTGTKRPLDRAQVFTVGIAGALTDIEVMVGRYSASNPILWELRDVSAGKPGTNVLASGSVPASTFPQMSSSTSFPTAFISLGGMSVQVESGDLLAIHLRTVEPTIGAYGWRSTTTVYAGGSQFYRWWGADPWLPATIGSRDEPGYAGFQTFVDPAIPEPSTIVLLAAGVLGLVAAVRRSRRTG